MSYCCPHVVLKIQRQTGDRKEWQKLSSPFGSAFTCIKPVSQLASQALAAGA